MNLKQFCEVAMRRVLTVSGFTTSIVILLIITFLFAEAAGLFRNKVVEEGYTLAVNRENPVENLSAEQIKLIFDEEITNWKQIGGIDCPIATFRLEQLTELYTEEELGENYERAGDCIAEQVEGQRGMIAFVPTDLVKDQEGIRLLEERNIKVGDVLLGDEWFPTATPSPLFGMATERPTASGA